MTTEMTPDDVREALAKRIIDRVEEIAAKGTAGDAVRQVPKGYDYGRHWPIMVAIEMLTAPAPQISEADALRFGKVAWVAYQDDKSWAKSVVDDCFSPADDLPEEALGMIAVARAVLEADREVRS